MRQRHITFRGERTTISLENPFWQAIDQAAKKRGEPWGEWVASQLQTKPENIGRASWLRQQVLNGLITCDSKKAQDFRAVTT